MHLKIQERHYGNLDDDDAAGGELTSLSPPAKNIDCVVGAHLKNTYKNSDDDTQDDDDDDDDDDGDDDDMKIMKMMMMTRINVGFHRHF